IALLVLANPVNRWLGLLGGLMAFTTPLVTLSFLITTPEAWVPYTLKRAERGNLVKEQLAEEKNIPQYLRSHWQKETGFAFPSGHTMFAASWALLAVGLLWPRRRTLTIAILLVWATGVMGSRLLLGMHWPRDLVVATLISWALVAVATWLAQRICGPLTPPAEENREIAQREQES
ncbi:DUF417 family protein, partial [Escherichia coli]|uniref:DUF417 family protein n=1 Tax=Escherichia coli TaxID=562 RepID=UPI002025F19B